MSTSPTQRFARYVSEPDDLGCINWTGGKDSDGYGVFGVRITADHWRQVKAHRFAWESANGRELTTGELVCHECDNPSCVNPAHLFVGDHKINHADRGVKGRTARGERSGKSRFTESDVLRIRSLLAIGHKPKDIAAEYACSLSAVQHIRYGRVWSWL